MDFRKQFKIIIAGAGVAGLTLANMLEKFDVDYVILESHAEIAPPVGASIGLFPNGLRILDQIGCYESIMSLAQENAKLNYVRDENGKVLTTMNNMSDHLLKRHGYPMLFFDRQWLLRVLYDQLKYKDRVLTKKKVSNVMPTTGGVEVTTVDGDKIQGSIIIGVDGIHSTVRGEMFRLGHELQPGYFSSDQEDKVPAYYKCSFGIAQDVPGWKGGEQHILTGKGTSQLVVSGPENRVYWFLFAKLPTTKYGKDIPRYNKEDEVEFVKEHINLPITENITFGHVYAHRLSSTLTPLHETVYQKWFFNRIMILGDAAHKPNPIGGQGGNGAIESCAEFMNALIAKKNTQTTSLAVLTDREITDIFSQTQAARHDRAEEIVNAAHKSQALNAFEHPLLSNLVWKLAAPLAGDESVFCRLAEILLNSTTIKHLPLPYRPRALPFKDELPEKPVGRRTSKYVKVAFIVCMGQLIWLVGKAFRLPITDLGSWADSGPMGRRWTGSQELDWIIDMFVSVFACPLNGRNQAPKLQLVYFVSQLISPLLIYTIEGYRIGNQGTLISLPSLFTAGMQVQGIGRMAPIQAAFSALSSHELPTGRFVRPEVAMALIPALTLGYVIPTILALAPGNNIQSWQNWIALWQLAPPIFSTLTWAFSKALRWRITRDQSSSRDEAEETQKLESFDRYKTTDVPILQFVYKYAFALQATAHISILAYAYSHDISLFRTFFNLPNIFKPEWNLVDLSSEINTFFKFDQLFATTAILASNLYSVWDLRRLGYIRTREAFNAAVGVFGGQALVGSGATWAALWYWREQVLSNLGQ
ncbi:hypothetical protein TruAng_002275 [Truncatella angustata]|nr:hypothetical protein TruAng_002275 [Truncatella angustata]